MVFISIENLTAYWHLIILGSIIVGLFSFFIFYFLFPSWRLKRDLNQAIKAIQSLKSTTVNGQVIDIDLIRQLMKTQKLAHCWTEFTQSLHPQTAPDDIVQEAIALLKQV